MVIVTKSNYFNMEFTEVQLQEIKTRIDKIGVNLSRDDANWAWGVYTDIIQKAEKKPCMCGSSAHHWRRAVETIREFVKDVNV